MKVASMQISPNYCFKDFNFPQTAKLPGKQHCKTGQWCIDTEGEVTAFINVVIHNAYKPIAIRLPCVVPSCDVSFPFPLRNT